MFIPVNVSNDLVGGLSNAHFMAFFLTDVRESSSYIKVIPLSIIAKSIGVAVLLFYFLKAKLIKVNVRIAWILLSFTILYSCFKFYRNADTLRKSSLYAFKTIYVAPVRVIVRFVSMYIQVKEELVIQRKLQTVPDSWGNVESSNEVDITTVVIGESVRRDFLGIYNDTYAKYTPFLTKVHKIQFNNVVSYGFQTIESLSASLMMQDQHQKPYFPNNIITLTKKAGHQVNWISNQGAIGEEDNFIAAMGRQSDYYNFVSKGRWNEHTSDDKMLEVLKQRLDQKAEEKQVYFMHMIGSHPDPCDITDNQYKEFVNSKNISCYIESIRRTDTFLEHIYNTLKDTHKSFTIVYFSDHGLYLDNNQAVYHKNGYKESYDVPLLVLNSSLQNNVYYNAPRNLKDFLWFYQELMSIKTMKYKKSYKFFSEEEDKSSHFLYNGVKYDELESNSSK